MSAERAADQRAGLSARSPRRISVVWSVVCDFGGRRAGFAIGCQNTARSNDTFQTYLRAQFRLCRPLLRHTAHSPCAWPLRAETLLLASLKSSNASPRFYCLIVLINTAFRPGAVPTGGSLGGGSQTQGIAKIHATNLSFYPPASGAAWLRWEVTSRHDEHDRAAVGPFPRFVASIFALHRGRKTAQKPTMPTQAHVMVQGLAPEQALVLCCAVACLGCVWGAFCRTHKPDRAWPWPSPSTGMVQKP